MSAGLVVCWNAQFGVFVSMGADEGTEERCLRWFWNFHLPHFENYGSEPTLGLELIVWQSSTQFFHMNFLVPY